MKRIYVFLSVIIFTCITTTAQVTISGSTGANGTYATLTEVSAVTGAFAAINAAGTQAGNNILITISADIVETGLTGLLAGTWASLTINPTGGASRQVSTTVNGALINLSGADNVTIDGLNTGGNALTFTNTSGSGSAITIRFANDASNNTITRCNLLSSTGILTAASGLATVYFASGTTTGNDNNIISQCNISASATGTARNAIQSAGFSAAVVNSNNTIMANNISDFFHPDVASCGISIANFNSDWTITGNKLYQTATRTATTSNTHNGINITSGSGYSISNNIIGFADAAGTGTTNMIGLTTGTLGGSFPSAFTAGGTANATRYNAINCAFAAGGTVSSIQNNTVGGIALYTSSGATATFGLICGIAVTSGNANIGTTTGNTIGSAGGASSIYAATTSAGGVVAGIYCTSINTINIQNNTIGGIDASGTTLAQATGFKGIDIAGAGTFTVSNNNVGNATANNIRTGYLLTGANLSNTATTPTEASGGGVIRGIVSSVTGATVAISNNIIQGIQVSGNASTYTGISSTGTVTTTMNINANQVGNAGVNAVTFTFATGGTVHGINIFPNASGTINLNNNLIYGITCLAANSIAGIITSGGSATATLNINNNSFINNVISGPAVSTPMTGITNSAIISILNITGNIIRSNSSTATSGGFTGIQNIGAVINSVNMTNNQLGNASGAPITFSVATSGTINCIYNTNSATTCTVNMNNNSIDGIHLVSSGPVFGIYNSGNSAVAININDNELGSVTGTLITFDGAQSFGLFGLANYGGTAAATVIIQGNDIRGIVQPVASTGFYQFITSGAAVFSQNVLNNTFTNLSVNTNNGVYFIWREGTMTSGKSWTCSNNRIVTGFTKTRAGNNIMFIYSFGSSVSGSTMTETNNNFSDVTVPAGGTQIWGINNREGLSSASGPTKTITGNIFNNITSGSGTITVMQFDKTAAMTCTGNTISNIDGSGNIFGIVHDVNNGPGTFNYSSNTISSLFSSAGNVDGFYCDATSVVPMLNINNNEFTGLFSSRPSGEVNGINIINSAASTNIYNNNINNLNVTSIGSPVVNGIFILNGTTINIYRNKINTLRATAGISTTSPAVNGIVLSNGVTVSVYNNFIADLRAPVASLVDAIRGISVTSATASSNYNLYYNSIYMNAVSTGTDFGTSGIYHTSSATSTTASLNMVDNIVVNTSTAKGAGFTAAYRCSGIALNNYAASSNYNLFYAGTPSATNLIFYDGTNSDQTLAAYQTRMNPRDANSISLMPNFVSDTDLHLTAANCRIDGRGVPVPGITTDIDGAVRDVTTPDIGADEFTAATSTILAGVTGSAVCEDRTVSVSGTTYTSNVCDLIARVLPSGVTPVAGKVNVCVTLDATPQHFNGEPYVQRHHDIEPAVSAATAMATITLYYTNQEFIDYNTNNTVWPDLPTAVLGNADPNRANVRLTQFHGIAGTSPSSPGNYPGTRILINPGSADVIWNGFYWAVTIPVTGFSGFYLHTTLNELPLPVSINYFTGLKQGSDHLLNWKVTCNSTPRVTMILERSADSRNFNAINSITADAARCEQPFNYTDAQPLSGMNYYRLKMTDAAGKISYSTIVALLNAGKGFDMISIAPNPVVTDNFKLNVSSAQESKMNITIFDMQGRLVNRQTMAVIAGFNNLMINAANLASGTYTIQAGIADERSKQLRFVKQ